MGRPYRARYERQVFQPVETLFEGPLHKPVPVHAPSGAEQRPIAVFLLDADPPNAVEQHQAREIPGKQNIAAATEHIALLERAAQRRQEFFATLHHGQGFGPSGKPEGVVGLQGSVVCEEGVDVLRVQSEK